MDCLGVRNLPFHTRRSFVAEYRHLLAWGPVVGLVEGQFASVVAAKSFDATEFQIAVVAATPMVANLSSLLWGMLCTGRSKIPLLVRCGLGVVLCLGIVSLIPPDASGLIAFMSVMALAQVMLVGVVTVRTAVWKTNYPTTHRGKIAARLQRLRMMMSVVAVLISAEICDRHPEAYRLLFPVIGSFGFVGILLARSIRIRGERRELRRWRADGTHASPENWSLLVTPGRVFTLLFRVLLTDRRYGLYCLAQFLLGFGNLMTIAVVVWLITRSLPLGDDIGYWVGTVLVVAIPNLVVLISVTHWGDLFDRLGVLRMRMWNVACWLASLIFGCAAALVIVYGDRPISLPIAVALLGLRAIGYGLGMGGGALAWNLGHLHFAAPEQAEIYMGVHVTLTGVRGLLAPLLGVWLWNTISWPVWLVAIVLTLLSEAAFASLARMEAKDSAAARPS